jgi:hypothetical protein
LATFEHAMMNTTAAAAMSTRRMVRAGDAICSCSVLTSRRMRACGEYASGCASSIDACTLASSARAISTVVPGASRPNKSVIRCLRSVFIVAPRWCGLVTMFAMISVSVG